VVKRCILAVCSLLLALATVPASAALKAWLDRTQVAPGDTVRLTLEHEGQTASQPDLTPLRKDFDILTTSTSGNYEIINGQVSSSTQLALILSPKHTGQLTIPPLAWGADRSPALTLTASAGGSGTGGQVAGAPARIFIESQVEPKQPYVLAAVNLTVRLYTADMLSRASLELPTTDSVLVRRTGNDEASNVARNGEPYHLVTRHYLLFPQRSGTVSIPGPTLSGQVEVRSQRSDPSDPFAGFFGNLVAQLRPIRLHGDPVILQVQPRPASASASYWLPARNLTLDASWHPGQLEAHAGDPITVDLTLRAVGLTAAQLPDLTSLLSVPGQLKSYPEQPRLTDTEQGDTVAGSREQTIALIADQPGRYSIPELHVSWWDTVANRPREATLPARTVAILPAAHAAARVAAAPAPAISPTVEPPAAHPAATTARPPAAAREPGASGLPWRWISLGLGLLWLATLGVWLWSRRARAGSLPQPTAALPSGGMPSQARAAFQAACRNHDAHGARRHLLAWAAEAWGAAPSGLNALARRLDEPALTALLRELDRACFAARPWSGEALAAALTELPAARTSQGGRSSGLAPLYP
jgi:hypothetical protein